MLQVDHLLQEKFPYYRRLLPSQRAVFLFRLRQFMQEKEFSTRKDLPLTHEMKVLVSAAAVQVTFGLDNYLLDTFHRIIIYPEKYYSNITGAYHKGDVNLAGIIALSWKDFLEGYHNPTNNRNLGLHEMGHAVRFDAFTGKHDKFFTTYFVKWTRIARDEYEKVRNGSHPVFRDYAGSNMNEFLSVCIEHFFETPEEFKKDLPELYQATCILLNQDPTLKGMGIGIRHRLLAVRTTPPQQDPLWSANAISTGCIILLAGALFFILSLFLSSVTWTDLHILQVIYLVPFLLAMLFISYKSISLNIYDNVCILSHWPRFSPFPDRILPFEHIISVEVHENDNMFTLEYLQDGELHERDFTVPTSSSLYPIKEFMDAKKVRVREYKQKRPGTRASRR